MENRTYLAIDLKSFYASVECVDRGLDPLQAYLVVADASRTEKTICLAVSPALKAFGIGGRARLFEVVQRVKEINRGRREPLEYITAPPRMARYMEVSRQIYDIYLKYISADDIHVYSVDEVFIDATDYLRLYRCDAHTLTMRLIRDILATTGITATAGIGTNLYLAKVAMDIVAKHSAPDKDGVRVSRIDEMDYRRLLWDHTPITDFWRIGHGTARRLEQAGIRTMGEIARCSLEPAWEEFFYKSFGVAAELLIDHAWGWEPCTMADIKRYRPASSSLSSGQVLAEPYSCAKGRIIVREMVELLVLDLVEKRLLADQIVLDIHYDTTNVTDPERRKRYKGPVVRDWYGRPAPKPAHGSRNFGRKTSSTALIAEAAMELFDAVADKDLLIRRLNVTLCNVVPEDLAEGRQMDLFTDEAALERERRQQETILEIRRRFGKNAILKGVNFEEGATTIERNKQIGGHKA